MPRRCQGSIELRETLKRKGLCRFKAVGRWCRLFPGTLPPRPTQQTLLHLGILISFSHSHFQLHHQSMASSYNLGIPTHHSTQDPGLTLMHITSHRAKEVTSCPKITAEEGLSKPLRNGVALSDDGSEVVGKYQYP